MKTDLMGKASALGLLCGKAAANSPDVGVVGVRNNMLLCKHLHPGVIC